MKNESDTQMLIQRAKRDQVYSTSEANAFAFGDDVAEVFDDMISRSVPGYLEIQLLMNSLVGRACSPGDTVYDLGCSTGTTLALIAKRFPQLNLNLVGIDSSRPMLERAEKKLEQLGLASVIHLQSGDITRDSLAPCRVVGLNYTLQFIPQDARLELLRKISHSLLPGGSLVLSEKTRLPSHPQSTMIRELHEDFKVLNGYSAMEVARKRESLKNVLVPLSPEENEQLLYDAGFDFVSRVFQGFEFYSWIASKRS